MSFHGFTKSRQSSSLAARKAFVLRAACCLLLSAVAASAAFGQREPVHYFHSSRLPPGTIGPSQLLRGGPLAGYFQPVEIRGPEGLEVSAAVEGQFDSSQPAPATFGMLIGPVYRLKITRIPRNEGCEVYPTIEVINRLYPPQGLENHFPIPVHFTLEELEMALSGRMVTRVIYLEDPQSALPVRDTLDEQRVLRGAFRRRPVESRRSSGATRRDHADGVADARIRQPIAAVPVRLSAAREAGQARAAAGAAVRH